MKASSWSILWYQALGSFRTRSAYRSSQSMRGDNSLEHPDGPHRRSPWVGECHRGDAESGLTVLGLADGQSVKAWLIACAVSRTQDPHSETRAGSNLMSGMLIATAATGHPDGSVRAEPMAQTCARFSEMLTA